MKKIILFFVLIIFVVTQAYAAYNKSDNSAYTPAFYARLTFCIAMNETQPLKDGGKIVRHILGIKGTTHICNYAEEQYDANGKLIKKTTCKLNPSQRIGFKKAMKLDPNSEGAAKELFEKFSKDEAICKVELIKN